MGNNHTASPGRKLWALTYLDSRTKSNGINQQWLHFKKNFKFNKSLNTYTFIYEELTLWALTSHIWDNFTTKILFVWLYKNDGWYNIG